MSLQTPERFFLYVEKKNNFAMNQTEIQRKLSSMIVVTLDIFPYDRFKPNWPMINFLCCASTLHFPARMSFLNKMWAFPSKEETQTGIISVWPALYQSPLVFLTYKEYFVFFLSLLDLFRNVVRLKGKLGFTSWFLQSCHYLT